MQPTETLTLDDQLDRELEFKRLAELRYKKKKIEGAPSHTTVGGKNVTQRQDTVDRVASAIDKMVADVESGKAGRGRPALAVSYLRLLQSVPVAILTIRIGFDAAVQKHTMSRAAMRLAGAIFDHYQFDLLEQEAMGLVIYMERKHRKRPAGPHKATIMRHAAKLAGVQPLDWAEGDRLKLGSKLFEIMVRETGLIKIDTVRQSKVRTRKIVELSPETAEKYTRNNEFAIEYLAHDLRPTIIPPQPWTTPLDGGYYSKELRRDMMRKTFDASRDDFLSHNLSKVYFALNAIQDTPWCINQAVHDVMKEAYDTNSTLGGLPAREDQPVPARPDGIPEKVPMNLLGEQDAAKIQAWKREAAKVHDENHSVQSKRIAIGQQLSAAKELMAYSKFYFPHNLDFRGRIYPLPPTINPQSDDFGKSLLQFANGKQLGTSGGYWLMVHIANLFGVDKISFDERVQWASDNSLRLLESAFNPLDGERFWCEADDPWCALAACFEYAGWHLTGFEEDYVSHLPIPMDGSCSGLQHFSAMLRDAEGGAAVNLTEVDKPLDIYTEVQKKVEIYLNDPDLATNQLCQTWRGKVTRKIVKRPCMTFAYSVTQQGIVAQIVDEMRKTYGEFALPGYDNYESAKFLGPLVERAIRETVVRAAEAMDWLKDVTRVMSKYNLPLSWHTPDGLPILQYKRKFTSKKHKVWFMGERIHLTLRTPTKVLNKQKQTSSVAPNFVHSMDGCHLRMVVCRMKCEGYNDFSMIHDSFGVHAADIDELNYVIRDEFIRLYQTDVLTQFREQLLAHLPAKAGGEVALPPQSGTLDLEDIRKADFFFS